LYKKRVNKKADQLNGIKGAVITFVQYSMKGKNRKKPKGKNSRDRRNWIIKEKWKKNKGKW
jgi:hypothetical protein